MSLYEELKRRNVFRVGIAYVVASWLLLQLTEVLTELLELDTDVGKLVILLLIIGFVPALIFAWAFELTPEGLKKEKDVDRSESITRVTGRKLDFAIIGLLVLAALRAQGIDDITVTEPTPRRAERARTVGATRVLRPDELETPALPFDFAAAPVDIAK